MGSATEAAALSQRLRVSVLLLDHASATRSADKRDFRTLLARAVYAESARRVGNKVAWARKSARRCARALAGAAFDFEGGSSGLCGFIDMYEQSPGAKKAPFQVWDASMLIQQILTDPLLSCYSTVVVDNFDDRTLEIDMLSALLRKIVVHRKDLHVLVLCDSERSCDFVCSRFNRYVSKVGDNAAPGSNKDGASSKSEAIAQVLDCRRADTDRRLIDYLYRESPCGNIVNECAQLVTQIHLEKSLASGNNIAVILPSEELVNECIAKLQDRSGLDNLVVYKWVESRSDKPIHIGAADQGTRNCILISNVLESKATLLSASFHGVAYAIDSLLTVRTCFDTTSGVSRTNVVAVTKPEASNRARLAQRVVMRLCTENAYKNLEDSLPPEMQRSDIAASLLLLKALHVENVVRFEFLSPPSAQSMEKALNDLHAYKAIDDAGHITFPLGHRMASLLPLAPQYAKLLLSSLDMGCTVEALTLVAFLSALEEGSLFSSRRASQSQLRDKIDTTISTFGAKEGDLVFYLNIFNAWSKLTKSKRSNWCDAHGLNPATLDRTSHIRRSLMTRLGQVAPTTFLSCFHDVETLQKCICSAFFTFAAHLSRDGRTYVSLAHNSLSFEIHSSSLFFRFGGAPPAWIVVPSFAGKLHHITALRSEWLLEVAPHFYSDSARAAQTEAHAETFRIRPFAQHLAELEPGVKRARKEPKSVDDFLSSVRF